MGRCFHALRLMKPQLRRYWILRDFFTRQNVWAIHYHENIHGIYSHCKNIPMVVTIIIAVLSITLSFPILAYLGYNLIKKQN
jgi:hypothetical protein